MQIFYTCFTVDVQMKDKKGHFLGAIDWPLLPVSFRHSSLQ